MASAHEDPKEVIEFYGKNKELMDNMMRNVALEEQTVEALLVNARVTEKETGFNELRLIRHPYSLLSCDGRLFCLYKLFILLTVLNGAIFNGEAVLKRGRAAGIPRQRPALK